MARELEKQKGVRSAEPAMILPGADPSPVQVVSKKSATAKSSGDGKHAPCSQPIDWSLALTKVPEAWRLEPPGNGKKLGEGIVIGHPDTGYTRHPEIFATGQVLAAQGYDFEDDDANSTDPLKKGQKGHGTSTASVIMSPQGPQKAGKNLWIEGVAPAAELIPLRVSTSVVHLSFRKVAKAIRHAADEGCHVISMSLGGPIGYKYLRRAIDEAIGKGVVVLAAAGNVWPFVVYPARFPQVVAVAACDCRRKKWSKSASGEDVDITAPGHSVWVARASKKKPDPATVGRGSGTSYAVATTAGACALWIAFHGHRNLVNKYGASRIAAVFQNLLKTKGVTTPSGWDTENMGTGILDAEKLLGAKLPANAPKRLKPKSTRPLAEIAAYVPGADRKALPSVLREVFGVSGAALRRASDEIVFHLVTNPALRETVEKAARPHPKAAAAKKTGTSLRKRVQRENPRLRRNLSPSLRKNLQGK